MRLTAVTVHNRMFASAVQSEILNQIEAAKSTKSMQASDRSDYRRVQLGYHEEPLTPAVGKEKNPESGCAFT